ncbi:relaxase [Oceaniradius stylonematis]|uniref:Relaxase n=1 Tax=Oceaniradius stylonematis TaxID=2184161 RepID=A0A3A8AAT7_9HYPH|nr:relaxase/mobilization nuclease domain-containing protein [Oceaniradius stylonematis]RKF06995.1 relaxase [Oceaniradius stylonematis]
MILKASQRGGGQDLAAHLMKLNDNEHIALHELRGFASNNLKDAFKESEAISRGTNCRQYLFSLSLNPPQQEQVPVELFEETINRIEDRLGLQGQPRAIVFHEKEGRRHAHCVWSRIDAQTMTAKQLSFFKTKLQSVSRDLYLENGWKLPEGLKSASERNPTNFNLAEWQQAKRQGIDPRWLKQVAQEAWKLSDGARAFASALQENGLFLAKGDRRGFVALDHNGEVYALSRLLNCKTKEVTARLGKPDDLPGVEETRKVIGERMTPAIRRHVQESRTAFSTRAKELNDEKTALTQRHRLERAALKQNQRTEWDRENLIRTARLPRGLRGLWHRLTGRFQEVRAFNESEAAATRDRHAEQRQSLIQTQLEQRSRLQERIKDLRNEQADQLRELRKDVGRFLRFSKSISSPARGRETSTGLKLGL